MVLSVPQTTLIANSIVTKRDASTQQNSIIPDHGQFDPGFALPSGTYSESN